MKICILDDDLAFIEDLREVLSSSFKISWALNPKIGINEVIESDTSIVLLDLDFNNEYNGLDWIEEIKTKFPKVSIIVLSSLDDVETVVRSLRLGAIDYIEKDVSLIGIKQKIEKTILNLNHLQEIHQENKTQFIFNSPAMKSILKQIEQISNLDIPILLTGESGVGKSMLAELIHNMSNRKENKFLNVHMPSISDQLFESELFGHEKGSFTGAYSKKIGKVEFAEKGTVLLDEVTEISPTSQAKLLRLVDKKEYEIVGNPSTKTADIRIISTTNKQFEGLFENNTFRKDLFYRLSGFEIEIPPLRKRKEDILPIAEQVLTIFSKEINKKVVGFSENAKKILLNYDWPGNVRELVHTVQKATILCSENKCLLASDLFQNNQEEIITIKNYHSALNETISKFKKKYFENLFTKKNGVINEIAKEAEIPRQTVSRILKEVGVNNGTSMLLKKTIM